MQLVLVGKVRSRVEMAHSLQGLHKPLSAMARPQPLQDQCRNLVRTFQLGIVTPTTRVLAAREIWLTSSEDLLRHQHLLTLFLDLHRDRVVRHQRRPVRLA